MAQAVAEGASARARLLRDLLARDPERTEFALRLTLICTLTLLVAQIYGTPDPALTVYISFFLNKPERTVSLVMNVAFVIVITLLLGFVLSIARQVINDPAMRVAAMALISFVLLFLTSASKLKPIGSIAALVTAYSLALLGSVPVGELATRGLLYAWLFIGIPAGVSLVINLLIARAPRRQAERGLARRLRAASAVLAAPDELARQALRDWLEEGVSEVLKQVHLSGVERTAPPTDRAALAEAAQQTRRLLFLVDALAQTPHVPDAWRAQAAATLAGMADAFEAGGYPVNIMLDTPPMPRTLPHETTALMRDVEATLARFTGPPPEMPPAPTKEKSGFFVPDAFTNPVHVQFALKVTGAAMSCYLLYSLLDWSGIHTALITCYIVSLGTAAETIEKLSLRIAGALVGAAAGLGALIWILPAMDSIGQLMALIFLATLPAAWIAAGSPRIAYAGFQMAFAFFLCTIQGAAPAFDLSVARDRVIGILLGNLVSYLFLTGIRPVSIGQRIDPALAALLRKLGGMARAGAAGRRALVPAFEAALKSAREDLHLLRYEPARLRAAPDWIDRRRAALAEIGALEGPVLLAGDGLDRAAERLDGLADRLDGREPAPAASHAKTGQSFASGPAAQMQAHLDRLDERLAGAHG